MPSESNANRIVFDHFQRFVLFSSKEEIESFSLSRSFFSRFSRNMPTGPKKKKYVNVFSNEGKERMIVRLPGEENFGRSCDLDDENVFLGRSTCECQAAKHKLIGNCLKCGRIVCDQEGSGPCFFCGTLVNDLPSPVSTVERRFRCAPVKKNRRFCLERGKENYWKNSFCLDRFAKVKQPVR